jgi:hypothetical protein
MKPEAFRRRRREKSLHLHCRRTVRASALPFDQVRHRDRDAQPATFGCTFYHVKSTGVRAFSREREKRHAGEVLDGSRAHGVQTIILSAVTDRQKTRPLLAAWARIL